MSQFGDLFKLIDDNPDEAGRQAALALDKNPNDAPALFVVAEVYSRAERFGLAANLYQRINVLRPDLAEPYNNLGMCWAGLGENQKARDAFFKAYNINKASPIFTANLGMSFHASKEFKESIKWCNKSLSFEPGGKSAMNTLGLCNLALGNWQEAWAQYSHSVGGKFRKLIRYQEEPQWAGQHDKTVVFYGEQGLGDEIMYASCIPDAQAVCKTTILECDSRLQGLFGRSFPGVVVHGTRRKQDCAWIADQTIDASLPVGQLPQFFRTAPDQCPGTAYLKADPERRLQWRALFDSMGKRPKIGIAWSGGSKHNSPQARNVGLMGLKPLIEAIEADWISLQYVDPTAEIEASGLPVRHWKRACETDDYDDTAALVAELDMVISVPTAVIHLAGALGIKTHCLTPHESDWAFWSGLPWYASVDLHWKNKGETWNDFIGRYSEGVHRLRAEATAGVQRLAALDHPQLIGSGKHHTAGALAATAQAARAYGVHV